MGTFIAMSGVMGKSGNEVLTSLQKYCQSVLGDLTVSQLNTDNNNCCIIDNKGQNTTVFYPSGYLEWDDSSAFISKDLNAPVFSLHIHDGDLWMYILYVNGEVVDQFNPLPDYWDDKISDEERQSWKGNAETVAKFVSNINANSIDKYLVSWQLDDEDETKAYPDDENSKGDWQLVDFMRRLGLDYPVDDSGKPKGSTYKMWTNQLRLQQERREALVASLNAKKPWWKFW